MTRISAAEFTEQDFEQALQDMTTLNSDWTHLAAACHSTPATLLVPKSRKRSSQQQWALPATHEQAAVRCPVGVLPTAMHTSAGAGGFIRSTPPAAKRVAASCNETFQLSDRRQGASHHHLAAAAPTAVAAAGSVLQGVHSDTQISADSLWRAGSSLSSSSAWLPASGMGDVDSRNAAPAAPAGQLQAMSGLGGVTASRTDSLSDDAVVHDAVLGLTPPAHQAQWHYQAVCQQQQQQQQQPTATSKQVSACTLQWDYKQLMHHQQQDVLLHSSTGPIMQMTGHLFMGSTPSLLGSASRQHDAPQMGLGSSSSVKR